MGRDFPPVRTGPGAHPASYTMGTGSFSGVNYGRGVLLTTHPLLVPWSWKSRAIPLPTLWATTGPVTGTLYLFTVAKLLSPRVPSSQKEWPECALRPTQYINKERLDCTFTPRRASMRSEDRITSERHLRRCSVQIYLQRHSLNVFKLVEYRVYIECA